jgi:group I intron endonuclease
MPIYTIYRIIFPNGKSYTGWTSRPVEMRKREHIKSSKRNTNIILYKAIRKYGIDDLLWETVYQSADKDYTLGIAEDYFIRLHQSHISENGYNMTYGGEGTVGLRDSEQTRVKKSVASSLRTHSQETKNKISAGNRGKVRSQAVKDQISKTKLGAGRRETKWGSKNSRDIFLKQLLGY